MTTEQPTKERWLPIPGYEGLYEVSDHGRVKTLRRQSCFTNRWGNPSYRTIPESIRKVRTHPNGGHLDLTLSKDGKKKHWFVHTLVLLAFEGGRPAPDVEIRHMDGDPTNNKLENLRYDSHEENVNDMLHVHNTHVYKSATHCIHGHQFDAANTYIRPDGNRDCRQCAKDRRKNGNRHTLYMREYRRRKREN